MSDKNNKKLILEEYRSEFLYKESKSNLKISFERVTFIFFVFFIIAVIFSFKVIFLSLKTLPKSKIVSKKENFRSTIVDKEGNILAKSVPIINLGINPNLVVDKKKMIITLKYLFPNKNFEKQIYGKKFFYIKKKISQE